MRFIPIQVVKGDNYRILSHLNYGCSLSFYLDLQHAGKICLAPCAVRHDKKFSLVKGNKRQLEIFDATDKDLVRVKISRDEQNKYVKKGTLLPFVDPEQGVKDR